MSIIRRKGLWAGGFAIAACLFTVGCGGGGGGGGEASSGVALLTTSLPGGDTGLPYEVALEASIPNDPGVFLLISGQLPTGVTLDSATGEIQGYPHQVGTFRFEVEVRDGPDPDAPRDFTVAADRKRYTVEIGRGPVAFVPQVLPAAQYRASYSYLFDVAGGTAPYTFEQTDGELPAGIVVGKNGVLGSFPTQSKAGGAPYSFEVTVTDANGETASQWFDLSVVILPLVIKTTTLPEAAKDFPYTAVLELASGGGGSPYQWSQVVPLNGDTDLASIGLEIRAADGRIQTKIGFTGPSAVGTFHFRVQVTDQAGLRAERAYDLKVNPGPVLTSITPFRSVLPGPFVVAGLNFQSGATLTFGPGTPDEATFTPTFVSDTKLTFATAPPYPGGAVAVRVTNPDGGFHVKPNAFLYPFQNLAFGTKGFINDGLSSTGLAAGDLTGDGLADVVHAGAAGFYPYYYNPYGTISPSSAGGLHLLQNQGGLAFSSITLDSGNYFDVKIADVNVDGKPDIVALGTKTIRTWINNPLGTFSAGPTSNLPNEFNQPAEMAVGKLNNDSIPDVLFSVSHYYNYSGIAYTMVGNGSGLFTLAGTANSFTNIHGIMSVDVLDMDGDGRHEALATGGFNDYQAPTFYHNFLASNGAFGAWTSHANPATYYGTHMSIAAGNFLGNGSPAVITMHTVDPGDGGQRELKLWSGPDLTTVQNLSAPSGGGKCVIAADFDLDLQTDFAVSWNSQSNYYSLPTTDGSVNVHKGSTKAVAQTLALTSGNPAVTGARSGRMASADLDGDGRNDLLVTTSYWASDYQPDYYGYYYTLCLSGDGNPKGIVFYLNASN